MKIIERYPTFHHVFPRFRGLDENLWSLFPRNSLSEALNSSHWFPATDFHDEEDRFVIRSDLPGLQASDIDITVDEGTLTIKGERSIEREEQKDDVRRYERVEGSFRRSFTLPDTADVDHISANSRDGVLEVVIQKKEAAQPKRIEVSS